MKKYIYAISALVLIFVGLVISSSNSQVQASGKSFPSERIQVDGIDSVVRFIDTDYNVVCYSASRYTVSCAPITKK